MTDFIAEKIAESREIENEKNGWRYIGSGAVNSREAGFRDALEAAVDGLTMLSQPHVYRKEKNFKEKSRSILTEIEKKLRGEP